MNVLFDGVSAAYQKKPVLEQIGFCADSGSITALVGRNGAGKSTLLRCLTGEKRDYTGRILLDGRDVRHMSPGELAQTVACLPQELPRPHVTMRELVSFGRAPYTGLSGKLSERDCEMVEQALDSTGMTPCADAFVDTLSGGERKKAFFAMTLAQDTPVVVLDEPTAHLDAAGCFEFLELLETVCSRTGKTFLVVMHALPEVLRCADRIVTLHDRRVVFDGTPNGCLEAQIPQRYFGIALSGDREHGWAAVPQPKDF